jgi:uncharacterized protein (TIGR02145 family)
MKSTHFYILLIVFGAIFSCIKFKELATLSTNNTSNLTINSVTSGGNITNGGGTDISARGVCWSTSQSPAVTDSHTNDGTGTGSFTSNLTGLTPGTKYYIRAYATNNAGTAYGNEISCTTTALSAPALTTVTATEVGLTSAKSGGTISSDGGSPITAKGVCWSTSAHSTVDGSKTSDGTGSTAFVSNLTPLTPGTTYYYRAYATNSVGTSYGNELTFTTTCTAATATTNTATDISATTATLNGTINGNGSSTTVTFEYGTSISYGSTASATPGTVSGNSNTTVSAGITGLTINTPYHYRVKAVNCGGTSYGSDQLFTTTCTAATATTNTATGVSTTTATLNGTINGNGSSTTVTFEYGTSISGSDQMFTTSCTAATATTNTATGVSTTTATLNGTINGNGSSTTVTFEYGTTTGYGSTASATPGTVSGSSNTTVSAGITGLTINTPYHYRVKAVNCGGTSYGSDQLFTTTCTAATTTTNTATGVSTTTATLNGTINGNGSSTTVTFEYGTSISYGSTASATPGTVSGSSNTTVSAGLTGLTINTPYHYRVKSVNCGGTTYGNDLSFTTTSIPTPPTVTTTAISGITRTSAVSGGNVTSGGSSIVSSRGVCWSTTANPTTTDSKTSDGTGTGSFSSSITGLAANTTYHVRAYAINEAGTAYGNDVSFESAHTIPTVTTMAVSNITTTTASSGGNVLLQGGENVTAKGVCWNTTGTPTVANSHTTDGTGLGSFASNITGLTANTLYYVRAYATNIEGTAYGSQIQFTTLIDYTGQVGTVDDIDGNTYPTIGIGSQVWMAENLKTTKYSDGTDIPNVSDGSTWASLTTGAYCWYNNDIANKATYGALYNFYTVNSGNLCPNNWHVPTDVEWHTMINYLDPNATISDPSNNESLIAGGKLKETGTNHWLSPNTGATNESIFTALPGGYRYYGTFYNIGDFGFWWSATEYNASSGWYRFMQNTYNGVARSNYDKKHGFSIRCVKD